MNDPDNKPTAIDLFCGAGGFSLGFIQAGWNVVCGIDNNFDAMNTYWCNLCGDDSIWIGDVPKMHGKNRLSNPSSGWISDAERTQDAIPVHTAMRRADTSNLEMLKGCWPEVWLELRARYNAPGGMLQSELKGDKK